MLPLGGDRAFVGHAIRGTQLVCDGEVGRVLQALGAPQTLLELERALAGGELFADSPERVAAIVEELRARAIVTDTTPDEEVEAARAWVGETHLRPDRRRREQMRAEFAPIERLRTGGPTWHRRAAVLGWCTAEALAPALREEARARGIALDVVAGFETDAELARSHRADFGVLVLGNFRLLAPLYMAGDAEAAVAFAIAECERLIRAAAEATRGPLLVAGCVAPQTEPLGMAGALGEASAADRIHELNRGIRRAVARVPDALYLDLERAFASEGKARLLDDRVMPYAHAGAAGGASNHRFYELVATSCLDALEAHDAVGRIRCVAVDLDGVLWPGEIADPDFSFEEPSRVEALLYGVHGGIHEALRALRARGILLAVVSKNVREPVLEKWQDAASGFAGSSLLSPSDFVALEIGWQDKSEGVRALCRTLGLEPSAMAFIDDSPLERAEVSYAVPGVWVLDEPLERVRATLLESPRFETLERSTEARERARTTEARLARDRALEATPDRAAFLASLEVRCTLGRSPDGRELDRVAELVARTNQFRTTPARPSRRELEALARDPAASIITLSVSDRFGSYGLTGAALTRGSELLLLTLSCRVIGAEVHAVLLRAALEACRAQGPDAEILVHFSDTAHNAPTPRLFESAAFREHPAGRVLPCGAALPALPPHCAIAID